VLARAIILGAAAIALAVIAIAVGPAHAQFQFGGTQTYRSWLPSARLVPDFAVTAVSAQVTLPASPSEIPVTRVCNTGQANAFVAFGAQSLVASVTASQPVYPGQCLHFNTTGDFYMAAITDADFTTLSVVQGFGEP
jgi:hypothetical protein